MGVKTMAETSVLTESILNTVKHMLGVEPTYTHFDNDIIADINGAINVLSQLGVVREGYFIEGASETFQDMLGNDLPKAMLIKPYLYHKVKLMFDPPLSGSVSGIIEKQIAEEEWRLRIQLDTSGEETTDGVDDSE